MTIDLERIERENAERKRLRDAATPGPWRRCGGHTARFQAVHSPEGYIVFGMADARADSEGGRFVQAPNYDQQIQNANLIAHARNDQAPEDIAALLAYIRQLQADRFACPRCGCGEYGRETTSVNGVVTVLPTVRCNGLLEVEGKMRSCGWRGEWPMGEGSKT